MNVKKIAQYLLFACFGLLLLYYTYSGVSLDEFIEIGSNVKKEWIMLAVISHLVNHFLRAFRWRLFVQVQGYSISVWNAFLAEMSGFFLNLVPPRMGEWMRCVILKRIEGIPVSRSLGGVVVERCIDVFLFFCLCNLAFFTEFFTSSKVLPNLGEQLRAIVALGPSNWHIALISSVVVCIGIVLHRWYGGLLSMIWVQVKVFFQELVDAIGQTWTCNSWSLWAVNLFILFFHFLVEYLSFFAIEDIDISLQGALFVFIAMNLGMSAPTPGGIGTYHLGVISTLMTLGVEKKYALVYATLTHSIQLFNAFIVGGICLLVASFKRVK